MLILTIDPGNVGTGVAVMSDKEIFFADHFSGKIPHLMYDLFRSLNNKFNIQFAIMEDANFFEYGKGLVSARTDSLVKLAKLIGKYEWMLETLKIDYFLIKPTEWKGNLPKEVCWKRIKEVFPKCEATSHALDAVGIGCWKFKLINKDLICKI